MAEEQTGNGRATIREVYELLDKVYTRINEVDEKLTEHLIEAKVREERIHQLELWRIELPQFCALRHAQQVQVISRGDSVLTDMRTSYRVVRWVIVTAAVAALGWGVVFWANSCAQNKILKAEKLELQQQAQPTPTSTIVP